MFSTRRAKLIGIAVFFVVAVLFVWVKPAHAYEAGIIASGFLKAFAQIFFFLARLAVQISIFALGFFIKLAEYNGYIDTDTVKVGWALVRDVANMFFVVVLLMIAFGTILGLENYQWNKTLIKFILAAVFINFSNLICGLIIDFAHVFTITFVNAISATAGGNLISMFNLDSVMSMLKSKSPDATKGLEAELFIASVTSFIFAAILAATMIAYAIIMVARVLVLWVLIILSPLAFILQVIPQTQEYAKQWWQKFGKQVVVAPFMVFFLWLAFATLTSGEVAKQFIPDSGNISDVAKVGQIDTTELGSEGMSLSLTEVSTWENMSEFFIAIGLLIVGLGVVQQTGAVGASVAGSAMNFGKKVATIATGYAAGRWAVGKTWQRAKFAGRKVAMTAPIIGGRNWVRLGQKISDRVKETPYLRHLPFIGIGGEYHEKLDKRVKDRIEKNKNARMAELSYYEEDFTKIPFGIGDALGKVMGLKKSSLMKRKAEAREDAAMKQKEFKTGMKTERTEARIRDWGRLHIETVEKNEADKWAEKQGFVGSDEERLAAFRQAAKTDDNLRKQFDKEIKKPVKSLIIPDLESGELRQATFSERVNARSAALMTYMEREKDTYTAVAKQKKGEEDLTYLSTPFGRQRFQDMINADLGDYGEEEINSLKNDEQREILEDKREQLRKVSFGMDKGVDLQTLLKKPIIRAIYAAENKGMTEIGRAKVEKELGSDISSAYIDPEIRGFSTSSEAATIITEFFKQKYDKMTEGQRGASLQANFRLLAKLAALGMPASELQKAAASAIYISAAEHGTVDDGVSAAASDANLLDDYNSLSGEEKANKVNMRKAMADKGYGKETLDMLEAEKNVKALERSKKIAESFNWIEKRAVTEVVKDDKGNVVKDSEGKDKYKAVGYKWSDAGDDEKMLTYSTYALTGGNEEYTRHSWQIGKIKDRDGSSYREAAEKFYGGEDKEYKAKAGD